MNDISWEKLVDAIDVKCGIERHGRDQHPLEDRPDLIEKVNFVEFQHRGEHFRLERTSGPAIVDRKTHYTHRAGQANRIENIYDPEEISHKVKLYQEHNGEWQERDINTLQLA